LQHTLQHNTLQHLHAVKGKLALERARCNTLQHATTHCNTLLQQLHAAQGKLRISCVLCDQYATQVALREDARELEHLGLQHEL